MADEQDKQQPSLELPKVFGRSKKTKKQRPAPAAPVPEPPAPAVEPDAEVSEPTTIAMAPEPATQEVAAAPEPVAPVVQDPVAQEPALPPAQAATAEAPALFVDEARTDVLTAVPPEPTPAPAPAAAEKKQRTRPSLSLPAVGGYTAAGLTGLLIGLLLVGLTAGALRGCEALRGTSTCGGGLGITTLVVILALLVVLGGVILRAFDVPDPTSSSFLALGMVSVVSLLFLLDVLMTPWSIVVIPLLTVAAYLAAQWVTTAFVEDD